MLCVSQKLNFGIDCDSRVAIVGPNGAGKVRRAHSYI